MFINEHTKISALLKHHPDVLDAIVALSADFKKLRNPVLRALMAKRTSIAMASKVGRCTPTDFFKALEPLGFEVDQSATTGGGKDSSQEGEPDNDTQKPAYLRNLSPERIVNFDVRSILAGGEDPLK